jgi:hypothetical protein
MERPRQAHGEFELFGILQNLVRSRCCWVRRAPGSAWSAGPSVEVQGGAPPASSRHSRPSTPSRAVAPSATHADLVIVKFYLEPLRTRVWRQPHVRAVTLAWVNVPVNRVDNLPRHNDILSAAGFCDHSRMPAAASRNGGDSHHCSCEHSLATKEPVPSPAQSLL